MTPEQLELRVNAVCAAIRAVKIETMTERHAQQGIALALASAGVAFSAEHVLGNAGRVDFFVPSEGIAIEVKVGRGWSPVEVYDQVLRYAQHPEVAAVILVSSKAMRLPSLAGKPTRVVSFGEAWL